MRLMSTGITAVLRSICSERRAACAGFSLIEASVAMTLLLAFVAVLGPHPFHARRIADGIDERIAAKALLRTLVAAPLDGSQLAQGPRSGETGGMQWTITAEPMFVEAMVPARANLAPAAVSKPADPAVARINWTAFHLTATVSWAPGRLVAADTLRLG